MNWREVICAPLCRYMYKHTNEIMNKESPSKLSPIIDQRSVVFQDPGRIVDHVFDDLLGGEDLAYLSGDATDEPMVWS